VTARRSNGRLSLVLQRDSADDDCWVGNWQLMASYKARGLDGMVMFPPDTLLAPVTAGTLRGPRYSRLLVPPKLRVAQRNVVHVSANVLDALPPGTNRNDGDACDLAVNIYARTRLRYSLVTDTLDAIVGESVSVRVQADVLQGNAATSRALARTISPVQDVGALGRRLNPRRLRPDDLDRDKRTPKFDAAKVLALAERKSPKLFARKDRQAMVAAHHDGPLRVHLEKIPVAGAYHVSIYIEGDYCPEHDAAHGAGGHVHAAMAHKHGGGPASDACGPDCEREPFSRILTAQVLVSASQRRRSVASRPARKRKRGAKPKK
jgi:hypothetical protein